MRVISRKDLRQSFLRLGDLKRKQGFKWFHVLGIGLLFVASFAVAVVAHLNLTTTRRLLNRALTQYLDQELVGTFALGQVVRLDASTVWLTGSSVYDAHHQRILSVEQLRVKTRTFGALYDWLFRDDKLTVIVESVWANGVKVSLLPYANSPLPSIASAFELEPARAISTSSRPTRPYRIALSDVVLNQVRIDNQLPSLPLQTAQVKRLAGFVLITPDGVAVSVKRFGLQASADSALGIQGTGTFDFRSPNRVWGEVSATLGTLPFTTRFDYQQEQLNINLEAPKITPEQGRTVLAAWPLRKAASVSLVTHGPLSALATRVTATVERSKLEIFGTTALNASPSGNYSLAGQNVDLSAFFGAAVPSDLDLRAKIEFRLPGDSPELRFEGLVDRGTFLGQNTPAVDIEGKQDATGLILGLRSHDPQLPLRAGLWMREGHIELDAQSENVSLSPLLTQLGINNVAGYASIRARGTVTDERLKVEAHATVSRVRFRNLEAKGLELNATFEGPTAQPLAWQGNAQIVAKSFHSPYFNAPSIRANVQGTPKTLRVSAVAEGEHQQRIALHTELINDKTLEFRASQLLLGRGDHELQLRVARAAIDDQGIFVQGLVLDGTAGHLNGELSWYGSGEITAQLTAESLNLSVLNGLLNLPPRQIAGTASATLELDTRKGSTHGQMNVVFNAATAFTLTNLTGRWEQTLHEENLAGKIDLGTAQIGRIVGDYALVLGGPLTNIASLFQATGSVNLAFERFRLEQLRSVVATLPKNLETEGALSARVTATRSTKDFLPSVLLSVTTEGLGVRLNREGQKSLTLNQAELLGNVNYDGTEGTLKSDWVISKQHQPRAIFGFSSQLDLMGFVTDPVVASSRLYDLPFDAWLQLPSQPLTEFETIFGQELGTGAVQTKLWLKGPLTDPHLVVEFQGERLTLAALGNQVPLDAQGILEFAHRNGETRILCGIGADKKVWAQLSLVGSVFANPNALRMPNVSPYDWAGKLELGLTELPIVAIPWATKAQVSGILRGIATVTRNNGRTAIDALLPIAGLKIQSRPIGQSLLSLRVEERDLVVSAKLIDGGALVDVEAHLPVELDQPLPSLRNDAPMRFSANAEGYDAGILTPFLDPYLGQIQGEVSGNLEATYRPATPTTGNARWAVGGKAKLRHGRGRLRSLGVNITDISLDAEASSTGSRTLLHIPNVTAAIGAPSPNLNATVVMEFEQLELKRLGASVTKAEAVPLVIDGVTQAKFTGKAALEMVAAAAEPSQPSTENGYLMDITLDELELNLPREMAREVVALAENKDITVLQPLASAAYKNAQPSAHTPYRIRLDLGRKARVTRKDFSIPVTGKPVLLFTDKLYSAGNVQLEPGGRLQLAGKTFVIERGLITLNPEEASNPRFEVEAQWRGPTHTVIATVSGTSKEAVLHLASDPPVGSEAQVLALLVSGSGAETDTTSAGLGVGATLFNEFLSETPLSSVELRTSQDEQHANYTAAVPLKENLWFEGTYQNANNSSLRPNSTTTQEGFSGTVDWRFHRNWSLRTEVGTLGAGADLLWQYRY